ncbi:calcium-activated chloride channel regulator 1-like [Eriocheir sinensis]|uniref:calcium-activated chloride channel regulator 1-like n=1 Tax=Eriocheir sinensis TaxID=95602 RepID=UPI0021CAACE7|nr:calcium-activated chloride channel regulator 1-like [Eriocheir sinensis]
MTGTWWRRRWWGRTLAVAVAAMVVVVLVRGVEAGVESRAKLVGNGYEGVVVGVSQEVNEEDGPALVEALKEVFEEASRRLYRASDKRAFFRSLSILIPRDWTSVNTTYPAGGESYEGSDIRVDQPNPTYHNQPYTVQSGGCGDPGQYIHLTPDYLLNNEEAWWYGPRGKAVLLEWAKYRWGVFDELGYPGDPLFPLFHTAKEGRVFPTHCANQLVRGRMIDKKGRTACGVTRTGAPDKDCRFVPYSEQSATSSLLSYPLLKSDQLVDFCGGTGREHDPDAPTKQNAFCDKRPAWDIIGAHADFRDGNNPPTESFGPMTVRIVQQADAHYALVLDYSGSMNDHYRVHKLRRTARRWLLHEVAAGSHVAIINFSKKAKLVHRLTRITDADSRKALADAIETRADGGTSIGAGLSVAARTVLKGKSNPVILLITDGAENENPRIDDVLAEVERSGARVITVAFGAEADPKLEKVAEVSGGKTFTVNDVDEGQMLEDAFHGALTFQPPPPLALQTVTIHEEEFQENGTEASSSFHVDFTVGRNLTLRLETGVQAHRSSPSLTHPKVTSAPVLIGPSGREYRDASFDPDSSTWTLVVPQAEVGIWRWWVGLSGDRDNFVRARVTSLPKNPDVQPITTRAWVSGPREVNASVDRVIIFAEVKQGHSPVVQADVRAVVTPPGEFGTQVMYTLLDNGQGADRLAGDGIYSRYMTKYPSTGRYSVKAQVINGDKALINKGFLTSPQRRRRQVEEEGKRKEEEEEDMDEDYLRYFLDGPDVCCGSLVPLSPDAQPTGPFTRTASGGSIRVTSVTQEDVLAPGRIRDLSVGLVGVGWAGYSLPTHAHVTLSFTAPGDDLDFGVVSGYELRMTSIKEDLNNTNFILSFSSSSSSSSSSWRVVDLSGHPLEVEGGTHLLLNLSLTLSSPTTFFAMRAWDEQGTASEVSNIASLHLDAAPRPPSHFRGLRVWVVVVVVVAVLCLVVVVMMLCLARKRKKRSAVQKFI